jgi:hypothetical protein
MAERLPPQQFVSSVLAILLWLLSFGLGLEALYCLIQLYFLISALLSQGVEETPSSVLGIGFLLALAFLLFTVGTTEYHSKRVGTRESWRLFAWSIGVEAGIIALYYIL